MKRTLAVLFVMGSLAALPALGQPGKTKVRSNTNPAGSQTTAVSSSQKTMTNTEGNKVLTSSRTGSTKIHSVTNPAGSHTLVMTKSGQGANKTISKTMTNTEGKKVRTSSRTVRHAKRKGAKATKMSKRNVQVAKLHRANRSNRTK